MRSIPVWYKGEVADYAFVDDQDFERVKPVHVVFDDARDAPQASLRASLQERPGRQASDPVHAPRHPAADRPEAASRSHRWEWLEQHAVKPSPGDSTGERAEPAEEHE